MLVLVGSSRVWAAHVALRASHITTFLDMGALRAAGKVRGERLLDFSPSYAALATALAALHLPVHAALLATQVVAAIVIAAIAYVVGRGAAGPVAGFSSAMLFTAASLPLVVGAEPVAELWLSCLLLVGGVLAARPSARHGALLLAGALFGIAALMRPTALVAPLFCIRPRAWRRVLIVLTSSLAVAVGGLALWLEPGGVAPRDWPSVMSSGMVFHLGNGNDASGVGYTFAPSTSEVMARWNDGLPDTSHPAYRIVARGSTGRCLAPAEAQAFWRRLALASMSHAPVHAMARPLRSVAATLHEPPVWDLAGAVELQSRLRWIAPVTLTLLLPLAILALLGDVAPLQPLLPALVAGLVPAILFFASGRYQAPLEAALAGAAGVGLIRLVRAGRDGVSVRRLAVVLAGASLAGLFTLLPLPGVAASAPPGGVEAADEQLRLGVEMWRRGAPQAEYLPIVASALVDDPALRARTPADLLGEPLRDAVVRRAVDGLRNHDPRRRRAALGALVLLAEQCPGEVTERELLARDDGDELALLIARCDLMRRDPDAAEQRLRALGRLPLTGQALWMAAEVQRGRPPELAMRAFTHEEDPLSELLAASSALNAAREGRLARDVRRLFDARVGAGIACTPAPR